MSLAWEKMDGAEAADRVLAAAVACQAREVNISCDSEGAAIFFLSGEGVEFFAHIPPVCWAALRDHLKTQAGIDLWQPPPATGLATFSQGDRRYTVEIRTVAINNGEDIAVRIAPC